MVVQALCYCCAYEYTVRRLFVFDHCVCSAMGACERLWVCVQFMSVNVVQMLGGRVQECDSCREETVLVLGGFSPEVRVVPPRGPLPVDVLYGRKLCSGDVLGGFHHPLQCFLVQGRTAPVSDLQLHAVGQDALNDAAVEVHQDV